MSTRNTAASVELICSDPNSAISSLSAYYQISEQALINILSEDILLLYDQQESHEFPFSSFLYKHIKSLFSRNSSILNVHWFHGTRCFDISSIRQYGILPLNQVYTYLIEIIDCLACRYHILPDTSVCKDCDHNFFTISHRLDNFLDHGPFATLNRQALITPDAFGYTNYLEIPEFIDDYISYRYGKNFEYIRDIYCMNSTHAIIEFTTDPLEVNLESVLEAMINYIYFDLHEEDMSAQCSTSFNASGNPILPKRIISIETL